MNGMKQNIRTFLLCLPVLCLACACQDDLKQDFSPAFGEKIAFAVDSLYKNPPTEKATRTNKNLQTSRLFLGLLEKDSVFISLREEENTALPTTLRTRGTYTEEQFNQFYVTALMEAKEGETLNTWLENASIYKPTTNEDTRWSGNAYWPKGEYTLHFFAHAWNVWEETDMPVTLVYTASESETGHLFHGHFDYVLPTPSDTTGETSVNDAARQPDLIFAMTPNQTKAQNPTVNLTFFHALSAIRFKWGALPEDVVIRDATLSLNGVVSQGSCDITCPPDEGNDFTWTLGTTTNNYTIEHFKGELADEESYMMIPQTMNEKITMSLQIKVGEKIYAYNKSLNDFANAFPEWEPNKRYTYTFSIKEYVEVGIDEKLTSTVKSNVRLQNTGLTTAYLRAAVVGYWENKDGDIIGSWNIDDTTIGQLTKATNWSTHWEKGTDGFYYHKTAVLPGEYTNVALFDKYELNSSGAPEEGAKLIINIVAQAIDTDLLATSGWVFTPTTSNE